MIRNLKVLLLAALAVTAVGAISASAAHAVGEKFHCESAPCRVTTSTDGTGATAHHVFVVKNSEGKSVSFTCESLRGDATATNTTETNLRLTGVAYDNCAAAGAPVAVRMNGCEYNFGAEGGAVGSSPGATVKIECPGTNVIEIELTETTCTFSVAGGQDLHGIHYHNIGEKAKTTTETTVEAKVPGIVVAVKNNVKCPIDVTKTPLTSEYTTGNTLVTAETDPATGTPAMINGWWE